ncbi:MAG TPA: sn-glycerol-1-phosphate dehydrogenase [Dongiaceae bacterium]|jgi:glycerol-1-phosphate dehydrogenase [NAD(P)+]|nr:sn-glycerol-1-phosphate dehydrogenase [Dongiaceae bacterium]
MATRTLDRLLAGTFPDPDGGAPLRVDTKSVVIARSLAGSEGEVVHALGLGRTLALVSDVTTHAVLGDRVERALTGKVKLINIVLPARPHPDHATVERLRAATGTADALIAVGSGTINDLCKYASALDKKPYAVFGTAPSMNGYVSVNAAITVGGLKKSLTAHAPVGVFLDIGVLAAAPARMIRSGLGDSLCRPTAQADWLLAHLLFDQPYREMPFALLAEDEGELFGRSDALMAGDHAAMESLVRTLLLSGFGTAICGSSQPASQGEHLISHYADMMGGDDLPLSFHGEQIGVTTLTTARLQETMLAAPAPVLAAEAQGEADVIRTFGPELGPSCWKEFAQKRLTGERLDAANQRIASRWPQFTERISKVVISTAELDAVLVRAGAPRAPRELSWTKTFYEAAVRGARLIRNRYTFLDLAANSGALDRLMPAIT